MHAGSEEIAKPIFESRPGLEYKLREDGVQSRKLPGLQVPDGGSKLLWPERGRDTVSLRCWDFHRSDRCLLMNLVGSLLPFLCDLFFTSCEAMEFAETGHRREERPDLPVSLLMVLNALRLECERSMELTASFHCSCHFCPSRAAKAGTKRPYQSQFPLGLGGRSNKGSCILRPNMARSCEGHVGYI